MYAVAATALAVAIILLMLFISWKWRLFKMPSEILSAKAQLVYPPCPSQGSLIHRLCPHNNVVQGFPVEQKDSLDEHLDVLTRKLADKESRLRLSKCKIRETQFEIDNLHAIDQDVRLKYKEVMESLRTDLLSNEKDCKKLQEQIEWVSRRRAELRDEVQRGQTLYGQAAADLASNLAELQRGRVQRTDHRVTEKPQLNHSICSMRHRKEPQLPKTAGVGSFIIKPHDESPNIPSPKLRNSSIISDLEQNSI